MINHKNTSNTEGDLVLVYCEDQPALYARIENIEPDIKKGWYRVTFLLLSIPKQIVTWILRAPYINGEPFTMGGTAMRLEKVERSLPVDDFSDTDETEKEEVPHKKALGSPISTPAHL